ncbi:MAG: hypothetical protein JO184_01355 [Gammaproteobacteria bacterium]|nr:hypothetical protein [Gammaproteobacteria bacterium]MBV8404600.1 hypothetical protein [Gammaproteobacteria bacterium]
MNKQLTLVGAAVAAALGTAAQALPPGNWTDGTITTVYYAGGGSAQVPAAYTAIYNCLTTSSIDVYTDASGLGGHTASVSYIIVSGSVNTSASPSCGGAANVGFMYKFNGGSCPNGASPFLTSGATTLSYPSTTSLGSATAISGFAGTKSPINPNYTTQGTPAFTASISPDWGVTDTEATLCGYGWNLPPGSDKGLVTTYTTKNPASLWVSPFAIAVTANVYAQKKNFSKAEMAAIYQGPQNNGITSWGQLNGDNGSPLTGLGAIALLDRSIGSGTRTGANAYFLGYPYSKTPLSGATAPQSIAGGYSTCSALSACSAASFTSTFLDISEKTSQAIVDDLSFANNHAGFAAIGVIGVEFPPLYGQTNAGTNDYDFVKINGNGIDTGTGTTDNVNSAVNATTQYTNVWNGTYDYATQVGYAGRVADASQSAFQKGVVSFLKSSTIADASSSTGAWPSAAEGILLDPATTGSTAAGNVNWTRSGNTPSSPVYYQATTVPFAVTIAQQK